MASGRELCRQEALSLVSDNWLRAEPMYVHTQEAEQGVSKNASMSNKLYVITNYSIIVCNSKMSAIDLFICLFDRVSQKNLPNQVLKLM